MCLGRLYFKWSKCFPYENNLAIFSCSQILPKVFCSFIFFQSFDGGLSLSVKHDVCDHVLCFAPWERCKTRHSNAFIVSETPCTYLREEKQKCSLSVAARTNEVAEYSLWVLLLMLFQDRVKLYRWGMGTVYHGWGFPEAASLQGG